MARAFLSCATPGCNEAHWAEADTYEEARRRVRLRFTEHGGLHYCEPCARRKERERLRPRAEAR